MGTNREYAKRLKALGYERKVVAFKVCDEIPEYAEPYGDAVSFHCAIAAEVWEEGRKPFCVTNTNIMCGGAVYCGLGNRKMTKEEFDLGMSQTIGIKKGYESRSQFRRLNQQIPHQFVHHTYQVVGVLEEVEDPDVVMIVASAYRVMRLCKAYTWKTGELVHGLSGAAWCLCSFPYAYRNKTISFATGDETSRILMGLDDGELSCMIHYSLMPLIIDNLENIQTGLEM